MTHRIKIYQFFIVTLIVLLFTSIACAENPWRKKLPFKEATIHYSHTGSENGTETLYIKDYGNQRAVYKDTTTKILFAVTRENTITITDKDWVYLFDIIEKTGKKSINPVKCFTTEFNKLSPKEKTTVAQNAEKFGVTVTDTFQGQIQKNATKILGYDCDMVSLMGTKIYSIHDTDITLKADVSMMGLKSSTLATGIETGKVPDTVFSFPEGIIPVHQEEADRMVQQMAVNMIARLKDPNAAETFKIEQPMQPQIQKPTSPQAPSPAQSSPNPVINEQEMQEAVQQGINALREIFGN